MIKTRFYNLYLNKFGKIMFSILYEINDFSYNIFMKEYSFEDKNLIKKIIKNTTICNIES